jgi:hypothetical protein
MSVCPICGNTVQFATVDGRAIPFHLSGRCTGARDATQGGLTNSPDSFCRKTRCPECGDPVFFVRHNGGSVFLNPPLGPPWDRHPCIPPPAKAGTKPDAPAALFDHALLARMQNMPGLITGVATSADVGFQRRFTLLTIDVAEPKSLQLLVRGGADSLVGKLVTLDPAKRLFYAVDDPGHPFAVIAVMTAPRTFAAMLQGLTENAGKLVKQAKLPKAATSANLEPVPRILKKYQNQGLTGKWQMTEGIALIGFLRDYEQDLAIHAASVMVLKHGEKCGDVGAAATLVMAVPPKKRVKLLAWIREFSPIKLIAEKNTVRARLPKPKNGSRKPFDLAAAESKPFFKFDTPPRIIDDRQPRP